MDRTIDRPPLSGAVLGLGMMGRHHARLLQVTPEVRFAGAVDPGGDRYGAVVDPAMVFATIEDLLATARPDFAIVAVPTDDHVPTVRAMAAAGVHMLIEKPVAASVEGAREVIELCAAARVRAAVGFVERCNPALIELRRRTRDGQLGALFLIATERVGPFPHRVRDVGVVKDLATHDLDLVRWIGGASVERLAAQTQHRLGRDHEDLVLVNGRLESGVSFNTIVDWLSPAKVRRTRVLGERGMLVANTLTSDLTFFENGETSSEWSATQALRGVSEGDSIRYAIARREPLLVELEAFMDFVRGDDDAPVVSLAEGLDVAICADAVLASAASGETVHPAGLASAT
jgi:UDP-N-acetylglucosamine 3-dehydrogenase